MLSIYPAIYYREKDNTYSAVFPDLNHLSTYGSTYQEATEMAIDCLAGYLYELKQSGELSEVQHFDEEPYLSISV
ncbi:type II toxin-antitoxin system HicB family antitoxin [uncultured Anaerovibrio sp.]|uniref:type II toxin-antitoxin system HicB family antitoxin n=1 Tax=uncultured Anaerovibrio sp. TaxID=361586 RepID=UPI002614BB6D|nr:type II toxin-antitoxin system HicB family antitoxin [uncultured Anaerovibrio sp.]